MVDKPIATETAHVLFVDRIGFSKLPIERAAANVNELLTAVESSEAYRTETASGRVISLDTGDGLALVFFSDAATAARAATELARATIETPNQLRFGLHTGPVTRRVDLAGKPNVTGPGIDKAQRVMSCSQGGEILMSASFAEQLGAFVAWQGRMKSVGQRKVKHGEILVLFRLEGEPRRQPASVRAVRPTVLQWVIAIVVSIGIVAAFMRPSLAGRATRIPALQRATTWKIGAVDGNMPAAHIVPPGTLAQADVPGGGDILALNSYNRTPNVQLVGSFKTLPDETYRVGFWYGAWNHAPIQGSQSIRVDVLSEDKTRNLTSRNITDTTITAVIAPIFDYYEVSFEAVGTVTLVVITDTCSNTNHGDGQLNGVSLLHSETPGKKPISDWFANRVIG